MGKQALRTRSGLGHRWGRAGLHLQVAGLRRPFPHLSFQELSKQSVFCQSLLAMEGGY